MAARKKTQRKKLGRKKARSFERSTQFDRAMTYWDHLYTHGSPPFFVSAVPVTEAERQAETHV